jgi:ABC-2 type transport system permease protein
MFAAIGSAVDSETDVQQFMLPVTLPLIAAYIISIFVIQNPDGPAAFWFSIIPFTSPIVMMTRLAVGIGDGGIPFWEVGLSMSLLIVTFFIIVWLASKIYNVGILMYGKKPSFKELLKWLKQAE